MTRAEAEAEAHGRWDPPPEGAPVSYPKKTGAVYTDGTTFGRGFKVGVWIQESAQVGYFKAHGEGATWEAAFSDADRRLGTSPRKG